MSKNILVTAENNLECVCACVCVRVTDGSYMQSSCDVVALQDAYIDAFISYCQGLIHTDIHTA